jgi:hypothetical protein
MNFSVPLGAIGGWHGVPLQKIRLETGVFSVDARNYFLPITN